jgi:hypothetical protein
MPARSCSRRIYGIRKPGTSDNSFSDAGYGPLTSLSSAAVPVLAISVMTEAVAGPIPFTSVMVPRSMSLATSSGHVNKAIALLIGPSSIRISPFSNKKGNLFEDLGDLVFDPDCNDIMPVAPADVPLRQINSNNYFGSGKPMSEGRCETE